MPPQPSWLPRIPALLQTLEAEGAPAVLQRKDFEELFGVRRRRALTLLHDCQPQRRGPALFAPRESVVAFLRERRDDEAVAQTEAQERAVAEALAQARRALTLPSIPLPSLQKLSAVTFAGLPPGIHLTGGELRVDFATGQELVEKLFALAQAFANDYESLEAALAGGDA